MVSLRRRIWFYGTWARLTAIAVFFTGFAMFLALAGFVQMMDGRFGIGLCFEIAFAAMSALLVQRCLKFFRDLRTGIQSELQRRNYCPHCEYDLRASVNRCPECGRPISECIEV